MWQFSYAAAPRLPRHILPSLVIACCEDSRGGLHATVNLVAFISSMFVACGAVCICHFAALVDFSFSVSFAQCGILCGVYLPPPSLLSTMGSSRVAPIFRHCTSHIIHGGMLFICCDRYTTHTHSVCNLISHCCGILSFLASSFLGGCASLFRQRGAIRQGGTALLILSTSNRESHGAQLYVALRA